MNLYTQQRMLFVLARKSDGEEGEFVLDGALRNRWLYFVPYGKRAQDPNVRSSIAKDIHDGLVHPSRLSALRTSIQSDAERLRQKVQIPFHPRHVGVVFHRSEETFVHTVLGIADELQKLRRSRVHLLVLPFMDSQDTIRNAVQSCLERVRNDATRERKPIPPISYRYCGGHKGVAIECASVSPE